MSLQGHFRQIDPLPTLPACPLRSDRVRTFAAQRFDAVCQEPTRAVQQTTFTGCNDVAVGTCVSSHAPRPDPYVRLSRIRLLPQVYDGTSRRIRSSACDTRAWLRVQYVLCWCVFPLAPVLRSTDSAASAPADASAVSFLRFVRRLHRYYGGVRLLVSVHHRLWLLTFPMRTVPLTQHLTARRETSQVPIRSFCT
jgi:hypothetical protein